MSYSPVIAENKLQKPKTVIQDYVALLRLNRIKFTEEPPFLYAGTRKRTGGWILYLSVITEEIDELFSLVLPFFSKNKIAFRIYRNRDLTCQVIMGELGFTSLAQVITVFPEKDDDALSIAQQLIPLTAHLQGPSVPIARSLGGIVYTRYGSIKPVIMATADGTPTYFIRNQAGQLVPDKATYPYKPVIYSKWPFSQLADVMPEKRPKFLKRRYGTYSVLKSDAKGVVGKGVDLATIWKLDWVLIKEGKSHMYRDDAGRDMITRLEWQKKVQNDLAGKALVPKVKDLFYQLGNCYLIMEFINGPSLDEYIVRMCGFNAWFSLDKKKKLRTLDLSLQMVKLVKAIHQAGYVHRDVTTGNFVVNGKNKLYLIDLELTFSTREQYPMPPFRLGTFGFMSPEQLQLSTPSDKEDIYAIGACLLTIFTLQHPGKFDTRDESRLEENIYFFTQSAALAKLIAQCLRYNPQHRPAIDEIKNTLEQINKDISNTPENTAPIIRDTSPEIFRRTIQGAIDGLASEHLLQGESFWTAGMEQQEDGVGNLNFERQALPGFQEGISGILYLISKAKAAGYRITTAVPTLSRAMSYMNNSCLDEQISGNLPPGLFGGHAGIALPLQLAISTKTLSSRNEYQTFIRKSYELTSELLSISDGIAGIGMALLHYQKTDGKRTFEKQLKKIVQQICDAQQKDGGWLVPGKNERLQKLPWFTNGTAGITYFLGCYLSLFENENAEAALLKSLAWLNNKKHTRQSTIDRLLNGKAPDKFSLRSGRAGIALVFIQGYSVTRNEIYKDAARSLLDEIPEYFTKPDLSFSTGIAGVGEVYLEAARIFKSNQWSFRAKWIAEMIIHQQTIEKDESVRWLKGKTPFGSPSFGSGQAGIIHFLIRYQDPENNTPLFLS